MDKELQQQKISAFLLCSCLLLLNFIKFFIKWTEKSQKQQIQKFRFTRSTNRFQLFGSCLEKLGNLFSIFFKILDHAVLFSCFVLIKIEGDRLYIN